MNTHMDGDLAHPDDAIRFVVESHRELCTEIGRVIVGQEDVVENVLTALFCGGHVLLVGVPGLAKTLLISTVARAVDLDFARIQFTPDLMPSDMTGTEVIEEDRATGRRSMRFVRGPVFCNVLLADEINRTPPKTQAALLEAMQERQVTAAGVRHELPTPFFVLATQNPIEQEGTYPLPEAQLDRFLLNVLVEYPTQEQELRIVQETTGDTEQDISPVLDADAILKIQRIVRRVPVADHVIQYALKITRATRLDNGGDASDMISRYVAWGAGPRASQSLILAAKAKALLHGASHVAPSHIQSVVKPVMRHRLVMNFTAQADGVTADHVIDDLVSRIDPGTDGAAPRDLDAVVR
jgi:MoxR-like ATPase